ncbi:MaoC family dehydratase [Natronomonas sp. F2-12]|jgi:itaconyl-CoA hydratase|uniref:MaoC family dehydratase n=1 Tax=Natronomonas aquatica TaxID=2841590 RepID=A0A9R1D796_9EURY|nr:MaoC family dehydratase [Natronomonas aquatica]MCQ4334453.1 MaoC family dehydratase [Natronomonas aquatica]
MVRNVIEVGENRYREDYGRYYEDFEVGDIYEHRPGRTITQTDNVWFTLLTMNTHPLHFNDEYGKDTEFGECLVNSTLTLAIVTGMTVSDVSHKTVANLEWSNIVMPNPVFHGDTLYAQSEVLDKRPSESREGDGIVTVETTAHNQDGDIVMQFERTMLIPTREKGSPGDVTDSEGASG